MNKKLLTAAVGAALAASTALAQADVKVYGIAHVSVDNVRRETNTDINQWFVSNNSSRFGIKASEDLGGGFKGVAQFEIFAPMDITANATTNRDNYVGLESKMLGAVHLGQRDTSQKDIGGLADLFFREQLGESRAIISYGDADGRNADSITYFSPKLGPVTLKVQSVQSVGDAYGSTEGEFNANVKVDIKPVTIGAAYWKNEFTAGAGNDIVGYRLAVKGVIGPVTLAALYQKVNDITATIGSDMSAYGVGVAFKFLGKNTVKAQYYKADTLESAAAGVENGASQLSVGYDYAFSKGFVTYLTYAAIDNDIGTTGAGGSFMLGASGHGNSYAPTASGRGVSGFSAGMRYAF